MLLFDGNQQYVTQGMNVCLAGSNGYMKLPKFLIPMSTALVSARAVQRKVARHFPLVSM